MPHVIVFSLGTEFIATAPSNNYLLKSWGSRRAWPDPTLDAPRTSIVFSRVSRRLMLGLRAGARLLGRKGTEISPGF